MLLLSIALAGAASLAEPARDMPVVDPLPKGKSCPETPMSLARKMGTRSPKAVPLNQLPPAQTFMAVDRRIAGCPAPLTMTRYRASSQR
jgi:hypothetical protein